MISNTESGPTCAPHALSHPALESSSPLPHRVSRSFSRHEIPTPTDPNASASRAGAVRAPAFVRLHQTWVRDETWVCEVSSDIPIVSFSYARATITGTQLVLKDIRGAARRSQPTLSSPRLRTSKWRVHRNTQGSKTFFRLFPPASISVLWPTWRGFGVCRSLQSRMRLNSRRAP